MMSRVTYGQSCKRRSYSYSHRYLGVECIGLREEKLSAPRRQRVVCRTSSRCQNASNSSPCGTARSCLLAILTRKRRGLKLVCIHQRVNVSGCAPTTIFVLSRG